MEWDKMLAVGVPVLLVGLFILWLGLTLVGWLVAGAGAAAVQAALIGAAVRGPD